MTDSRIPDIALRKEPKQARSTDLVAAILEAATLVLEEEGAQQFTTARVAEKAGVSVGSLYQYFPNKASILFRLQSDEWRETSDLVSDILEESARPPVERLRTLVHAFLLSECEEAEVRGALDDAAPLYRDAPEAKEAKSRGGSTFRAFMAEVLSDTPDHVREAAGSLIMTTLTTVGKDFSETPRSPAEIEAYAEAMADMFCAYVASLQAKMHD
ncbi:TetR family transcriptional regulator [Aurantiacibacter flavus]|uniref:TetR family transcriptional regulator n=1 Tax=Aurantiacibacter flavus TaxID=3145232 RepID=A0ABV0D2D9_9SPHN